MAPDDSRDFQVGGSSYRATSGASRIPSFDKVHIADLRHESRPRIWTLIEHGALPRMSHAALKDMLASAENLSRHRSAEDMVALHRDRSVLVVTRGQWNLLRATAYICGWRPNGSWEAVSAVDTGQLAAGFRQLRTKLEALGIGDVPLLPSSELLEFLGGGGFAVTDIG